jgi:RNA polymerase sigma-54 factor
MTKTGIVVGPRQQFVMTTQLQQAIRLLQLSNHELNQEIQQVLESNIMLEMADEDEYENLDNQELSSDLEEEGSNEVALETLADEIPKELAIDSNWEDIYSDGTLAQYDYPSHEINSKERLTEEGSTIETLRDYLQWQLDLTPFSDLERACATAIIDAIDSDGYLRASLEEIAQSLGKKNVSIKVIKIVLRRIQHFDPIGVGARDLRECLQLQLAEYEQDSPWLKEAKYLVQNHLDVLGMHDYAQLNQCMMLTTEELRKVVKIIQSLKPCPGAKIEPSQTTYIVPDVFVKKVKGQWKVELNSENSPKLRINAHYASMIPQFEVAASADKKRLKKQREDKKCLKNHLQDARWFIKSLESRHDTLLKVTQCVVKRQSAFLEYGEEAMKPLVLNEVAEELELHESTISRVTTQKYIHTPRGLFELKYFFSSHVSTKQGGECASTAIRAMIKKMIAAEDTQKPLSDSKIVKRLSERGINVARRTVAKYREAMLILSSNERKRLVVKFH